MFYVKCFCTNCVTLFVNPLWFVSLIIWFKNASLYSICIWNQKYALGFFQVCQLSSTCSDEPFSKFLLFFFPQKKVRFESLRKIKVLDWHLWSLERFNIHRTFLKPQNILCSGWKFCRLFKCILLLESKGYLRDLLWHFCEPVGILQTIYFKGTHEGE